MILNMTPELQNKINDYATAGNETPEELAIRLLQEYADDCDDADRICAEIDSGKMEVISWPKVRAELDLVN